MRWVSIAIRTNPAALEAVSAALEAHGTGGTLFGDGPTAIGYLPADDRFEGTLQDLRTNLEEMPGLGIDPAPAGITLTFVEDTDWANAWKDHYKPSRITNRLTIAPTWSDYTAAPGELVIRLDPGMAFGTGGHPSTRLCLRALDGLIQGGEAVADVGTGSGVLAIAASLLGASSVLAVDDDPIAVRVADENVRANGTSDRIRTALGSLLEDSTEVYDVVVANILPHVVIALAPSAAAALTDGGVYLTSGISLPHEATVLERVGQYGLTPCGRWEEDQWVALAFRKG